MQTLNRGLQLARNNPLDEDTIRVAEGVYLPDTPVKPGQPQTKSFFFSGGVPLLVLGGFPATGEPSDEDRDPDVFVSVLSADIDQDDPIGVGDNSYQPVWIEDAASVVQIDGFRIQSGIATVSGGGTNEYEYSGGGIYSKQTSGGAPLDYVIQRCVIVGNVAREGGGVYMRGFGTPGEAQTPSIRLCSIINNEASRDNGGAISSTALSPEIYGCVVVGNTSNQRGAIYIKSSGSGASARLESTTVAFNRSKGNPLGVQFVLEYTNPPASPKVLIRNSIIVRPLADTETVPGSTLFNVNIDVLGVDVLSESSLSISYSNVSEYNVPGNPTNPDLGDFNLSLDDVLFVDEGLAGAHSQGDFRLRACSPLVNAGSSISLPGDTFDADNDQVYAEQLQARDLGERVLLGEVDIGAFEATALVRHECAGDMNGDGCVDAADLALLLGAWGPCLLGCNGDFDCSGDVGASDLGVLLGGFGQCCSSATAGAGGGAAASESCSPNLGSSASAIAQLFGFGTITEFADWIASLPSAERDSLLLGLFGGAGGES